MTATQPRQKLTLINGTPVTIALQYARGKEVTSFIPGAPNQVYYSLTDGRSMYLPLEVGVQIDQLRLKPGEPFTLCKNSPHDWDVKKVEKERDFYPPLHQNVNEGPVNGAGEDYADILERCYERAICIAVKASEKAKGSGLMIAPSFEDIRAISATLLISETGRR